MDVDEQTEVIRVPKHNDVDALELMNDYNSVIYESIHSQLYLNNYYNYDLIHLAYLFLKSLFAKHDCK